MHTYIRIYITFVQESLEAGAVIALISLDVQGAFNAAW